MSAQASAYAALYLAIVTDALNDTSYHAYLAELDYGLSGGRFGVHVRSIAGCVAGRYRRCAPHTPCRVCLLLQLSFSGFTEKMPRLAESVMTRLASGEVLEDRFVVVQEQVLRGYVAPTLVRWQWLCGEVVVHTRVLRLLFVLLFPQSTQPPHLCHTPLRVPALAVPAIEVRGAAGIRTSPRLQRVKCCACSTHPPI